MNKSTIAFMKANGAKFRTENIGVGGGFDEERNHTVAYGRAPSRFYRRPSPLRGKRSHSRHMSLMQAQAAARRKATARAEKQRAERSKMRTGWTDRVKSWSRQMFSRLAGRSR